MITGYRKGTSQTVWIVTSIIIALAAALILIALFTGTTGDTRESTQQPIETGGNTLKIQMCKQLCDSCLRTNMGTSDTCSDWGNSVGEGCTEPGINVECPYDE